MVWQRIGSITVKPEDGAIAVGALKVPTQGGIELMARQTSADQGFRFAFGLVSFRSPIGLELGTVKCWPGPEWGSFRLGAGLSSRFSSGVLLFEPRTVNLRWIKGGFPWSVEFMADVPLELPQDRIEAPGFVNPASRLLRLVQAGTQGRLRF